MLFYLARKYTSLTLVQIGARVNKRHSTVLKGIATIEHNLTAETAAGRQTAAVVRLIERSAGCVQNEAGDAQNSAQNNAQATQQQELVTV